MVGGLYVYVYISVQRAQVFIVYSAAAGSELNQAIPVAAAGSELNLAISLAGSELNQAIPVAAAAAME